MPRATRPDASHRNGTRATPWIQEVITLMVFSVFSVLYLEQPVRWNHAVGFAMIVGAVGVIFKQW